jgi:hypothetical protein
VDIHRLVPEGVSTVDGRSLLGADPNDPPASKHERANELLADVLGDNKWHRASDVKGAAKRSGVSDRTLQRAAQDFGIEHEKRGRPPIGFWRLPVSRQADGAKPNRL